MERRGACRQLEQSARNCASCRNIDAAVLDLNLHGEESYPAAEILRGRRIPFVFATGYGSAALADPFQDVPLLTKPYVLDDLDRALHQVITAAGSQLLRP